jgi:hypothetical protein
MWYNQQRVSASDQVSDDAGLQKLREVIERMQTWRGALHPSPLFGPLDRELWTKVNLLHCEHQLGFLTLK